MVDTVARCGARICLLRFRTSMSRTEKRPRMVACARHCAPMCSVAIRSCPWARRGADRGPSRRVAPPDMRRRTPRGDWTEPAAADEASARWESRSLRERFRHSELYHGVSLTVHGSSVRVIESPCVLVACRVLSFRPARTAVQKADLITRFGPSLHSETRPARPANAASVGVCLQDADGRGELGARGLFACQLVRHARGRVAGRCACGARQHAPGARGALPSSRLSAARVPVFLLQSYVYLR